MTTPRENTEDKITRLIKTAEEMLYRADRDPRQAGNGVLIAAISAMMEILKELQKIPK